IGNAKDKYEKEAKELLSKSENKTLFFPTQRYTDLPRFYQASDLCVFPKQSSLSFYDVQACGIPVLAEDNSLNKKRLNNNNGLVFKSNSSEDLRSKILRILSLSEKEYILMSRSSYNFVKQNFDYEKISKDYTDILSEEYRKFHNLT